MTDMSARPDALAALRSVRFRKRTAKIDRFDAFYQAYIAAIIVGVGILVLSGWAGGDQLTASQLRTMVTDGPPVLGVLAALAAGLGLRSGSRGGPIALEAAEVRHVLLAPVDVGRALRRPALRQARFLSFAASIVGGVAGQLIARRTDGNPLAWTLTGSGWAVAVASLGLAAAWCAAGWRIPRPVATAAAGALLVWPVLEVVDRAPASPFSLLGRIPFWTAHLDVIALTPLPAIALVAGFGLRRLGNTSIELLARRSALVGQAKFAATMRDLRTVLVLRRQLLQERSRVRPWLPTRTSGRRLTGITARGWRSLMRTPGTRLLRMAGLAIVAAFAALGAYDGAVPLLAVAGIATFLVGLDAIEPLAQEIDHSVLVELAPVGEGAVHSSLLVVPLLTTATVAAVGVGAVALTGLGATGLAVAGVTGACAAMSAVAGAAISTIKGAPDPLDLTILLLPPEAAGSRMVWQAVFPPLVASIGYVPVLLAHRAVEQGFDPTRALSPGATITGLALLGTIAWIRARPAMQAQMAEMAAPTRRPKNDIEEDD